MDFNADEGENDQPYIDSDLSNLISRRSSIMER
jgi:hypothetical protein